MANGPGNVSFQPFWLKTPDWYEVRTVRQDHDDAIYAYGEYSLFILLWNATDFSQGLVQHCPNCYEQFGAIAEVYNQPAMSSCPICYGSSFFSSGAAQLGGLKARIVRPAMWNSTDDGQKQVAQGVMVTSTTSLQTTSDFRMRSGDYVVKADASRWRIQPHTSDYLISGFQAQDDIRSMVGINYPEAIREDESSPAYLVPPTDDATIKANLDVSVIPNYPISFTETPVEDIINGSLIADDFA